MMRYYARATRDNLTKGLRQAATRLAQAEGLPMTAADIYLGEGVIIIQLAEVARRVPGGRLYEASRPLDFGEVIRQVSELVEGDDGSV